MKFSIYLATFFVAATLGASNVIEVTDKNFDEVVLNSGKDTFVDFYADWCGHCKTLAPTLEELADTFESKENIQIVKINADKNKKIGKRYQIEGYPMLKFFKSDDVSNPVEYEGGRDLESLGNFVQSITNTYLYVPKVEPKVIEVDDISFDEKILKSGIPSFLAVTASWCGHCKQLHPEYEKLAGVFANDKDAVLIGQTITTDVPGEKIMAKYNIKGFPTVLFFDGVSEEPEIYTGGRTLDQMVYYINQKTGIHRDEDGSLLPLAGRISEFDKLVKPLLSQGGQDVSTIATDVLSQIKSTTGDMSNYYRKLINKVINGEQFFFDKEISRLNRIIDGGKLTRSKLDSMQKRLNVLNAFVEN